MKNELESLAKAIADNPYLLTPDQWASEARQALKLSHGPQGDVMIGEPGQRQELAPLFVAAPALLEACKRLLEIVEDDKTDGWDFAVETAQEAIKQAEGKR